MVQMPYGHSLIKVIVRFYHLNIAIRKADGGKVFYVKLAVSISETGSEFVAK